MSKKLVDVRACNEGSIIAGDVLDDKGTLIVPRNILLSKHIIERLEYFNIDTIPIYVNDGVEEENSLLEYEVQGFEEKYQDNISIIKETIDGFSKGEQLEIESIKDITLSVFEETYNKNTAVRYINRLKYHDKYTYHHSINVSIYSSLIAKWMGLEEDTIKEVVMAAILHDIGKTQISSDILNKKDELTEDEFERIKKHTILGYELIKDDERIDDEIKSVVLCHHEREDGSGYPYGITGKDIGLYSKIIAVSDFYDALTSRRAYKEKVTPFETVNIFHQKGLEAYDLEIAFTFFKNILNCYIGEKVITNEKKLGEVVYIPPHNMSNPIIKVEDKLIDLSKENNIKIIRMA